MHIFMHGHGLVIDGPEFFITYVYGLMTISGWSCILHSHVHGPVTVYYCELYFYVACFLMIIFRTLQAIFLLNVFKFGFFKYFLL